MSHVRRDAAVAHATRNTDEQAIRIRKHARYRMGTNRSPQLCCEGGTFEIGSSRIQHVDFLPSEVAIGDVARETLSASQASTARP